MAYFILLPAFLGWLLVCGAVTLTTRCMPSLGHWYPYLVRVYVWASVGAITANLVLIALLALGMQFVGSLQTGSAIRNSVQVMWGMSALLGPFAVSAFGWIGGACVGVYLARQRRC
jgi:hypothetical protein